VSVALPAICLVSFSFPPAIGGVPRKAEWLAQGLAERKHRVTVVAAKSGGDQSVPRPGFPVHRLSCAPWVRGLRRLGEWHFMLRLSLFLLRHRAEFDVFHNLTGFAWAFATVLASKLAGKKALVSMEGGGLSSEFAFVEQKQFFGRFLTRFVCRNADCFAAANDAMLVELSARGVADSRLTKIYHGVPGVGSLPTQAEKKRLRQVLGIDGDVVALYTGRIDLLKDLGTLIRAWSDVARLSPAATLLIIGDGEQRREMEREATALGLRGSVRFLGEISLVDSYLALSDIFILPSLAEGMSVSLLEAMSYGLAVVVSDIPANREAVVHGAHGLVCPPGDSPGFAQTILKLIDDPSLRETLGEQAARRAKEQFSVGRMVDRYADLYAHILRSSGRVSDHSPC
jgi:glycosyltransferase involved in cell wall biosynthesis